MRLSDVNKQDAFGEPADTYDLGFVGTPEINAGEQYSPAHDDSSTRTINKSAEIPTPAFRIKISAGGNQARPPGHSQNLSH